MFDVLLLYYTIIGIMWSMYACHIQVTDPLYKTSIVWLTFLLNLLFWPITVGMVLIKKDFPHKFK